MRTASLLVYLFGLLFTNNFVLIFIITMLLLATDFYYLKNIAGRRLVGLRWWNEVDTGTGNSHWVFESSDPNTRTINATDSRFFWMALYVQPLLWVALAVVAIVRFSNPIWLSLVGEFITFAVHVSLRERVKEGGCLQLIWGAN
ncbi:MAG: Golgi apparatus membrane protein tvp23 [Pleopsidium flavum]|nr:MAG: Golgi apparatus membrane protein tvp23 [Pleopsidium flavum]